MPMSTTGDLRQHFISTRTNTALKTELNTLVEELTTGQVSDLTSHLGVGQTQLSSFDRQLELLDRYSSSNIATGQMLSTMQIALENIEQHRSTSSSTLLTINDSSSLSQISDAGYVARSGFDAAVQSLNMRSADQSLFGGNDVDSSPLASADDMIADLQLAIAGLTDAADIADAIDDWFMAPGGGFETIGYQGDSSGSITRQIDATQSVEIGLRADDDALRSTLKAFALGAIAGDQALTMSVDTRQTLQGQAAEDLLTVASSLTSVQARLGYIEGLVEETSVRISAQESSYGIARNTLVSADPFETATRLESVQLQLETHYTLTARLSRLSLTEYLR